MENQRLREENAELWIKYDESISADLQEKERQLLMLKEVVRVGEEREKEWVGRCTGLEEKTRDLEEDRKEKEMVYREAHEREQAQLKGLHKITTYRYIVHVHVY